ncbi:MAG: PAS domain S-box protein [Prochloraceae cyanobacterium]
MKIWQKLMLAWGVTSTLLGIISILTIRIEKEITSQTNEVINQIVREAEVAGKMLSNINSLQNQTKKIIIETNKATNNSLKIEEYRSQIRKSLNKFETNLTEAKQATENQKKSIELLEKDPNIKKSKIKEEEEQIKQLEVLTKEFQLYEQELTAFLKQIDNQEVDLNLDNSFTEKINNSIAPTIQEYYEDSLTEVRNSELVTQRLTSTNIRIIRHYTIFTLFLTSILFVYIYRSIYLPIKSLKIGAFELFTNFTNYKPIEPKNPHDELGDLTKYFNYTVKRLKENVTSKAYVDNIINSISQNLIVLDRNKNIQKVNNNTVNLLGYSESELLEKSIEFILAPNNNLDIEDLIELDNSCQNCLTIGLLAKSEKIIEVKAYFSNFLNDSKTKKEGIIFLAIETENLYLDEKGLIKSKKQAKSNSQIYKNKP